MATYQFYLLAVIMTVTACANGNHENLELETRSAEKRCLELEKRWDEAQIALLRAENRQTSSWIYHVADSFNPLTSDSDETLQIAKTQEQRTRENYYDSGCTELNKYQIKSTFDNQPAEAKLEKKPQPEFRQAMNNNNPHQQQSPVMAGQFYAPNQQQMNQNFGAMPQNYNPYGYTNPDYGY